MDAKTLPALLTDALQKARELAENRLKRDCIITDEEIHSDGIWMRGETYTGDVKEDFFTWAELGI
jgi:hypothetical protein